MALATAAALVRCVAAPALARSASLAAQSPAVTKLHIRAHKVLEVQWTDGVNARFGAELLRVSSPSAENAASGGPRLPAGRRHVGILRLEPVGSYAVRIVFDDLHDSGIYTWEYLRELSVQRFARGRAYVRALRAAGLSRDIATRQGSRNQ